MQKILESYYTAISDLFARKGYKETQVKDVAQKLGISVGSVYKTFTGKKAMYHFGILCGFGYQDRFDNPTYPIDEQDEEEICGLISLRLNNFIKELRKNLTVPDQECWTFKEMLSCIFDKISSVGTGVYISGSCNISLDIIEVVSHVMHDLFQTLYDYFVLYTQRGYLRQVKQLKQHMSLVSSILSWWAMNIRYQTAPDFTIDRENAKDIALDTIMHAYVKNVNLID
ncbi:helix-turn-helix transcriptional regulator [Sedimentibacter sp. zth1]|uniref:TetR/AcrR family transcriptional regulator n=1 Tax=Sedimentibacter sp. zth1 TaxID=2816908 RepID=UPI001A92C093|nr:helix-turn-helix domain-containing protein [Sedimentibacter sp. zth1]QSX06096.1 helix-turn-helix transcriptional regulator [Sedimentibacter sp. zth1]